MSDFSVRSDNVDVEQIMKQIRSRIREKRGVDYTEEEIRELASVKLEKFIDPKGVRSGLLEEYRRVSTPAAPAPNYAFGEDTLYETHRGPIKWIRSLLRPLLKMLFNPNPLIQALHIQADLNQRNAERWAKREQLDALHYEVIHNLVVEVTRSTLEVKTLKMRLESIASRLDFDERRARALEGVVQYRPGVAAPLQPPTGQHDRGRRDQRHDQRGDQRHDQRRDQRQQGHQGQPRHQGQQGQPGQGPRPADPASASQPGQGQPGPGQTAPSQPIPGQPGVEPSQPGQNAFDNDGNERRSRRRRRRGRRRGGADDRGPRPDGRGPDADVEAGGHDEAGDDSPASTAGDTGAQPFEQPRDRPSDFVPRTPDVDRTPDLGARTSDLGPRTPDADRTPDVGARTSADRLDSSQPSEPRQASGTEPPSE